MIVGLPPRSPPSMVPYFRPGPSIVGMGDIFSDIAGDLSSAVSGAVNLVPGLNNLINGPLRDFANTPTGSFILNVIADNFAIATVSKLGPAIAAMWAIPGVARGDSFDKAIIEGTSQRLQQTAAILGVDVGPVITAQLTGLTQQLVDQYGIGQVLPSIEDIANQFGVRQDIAAFAKAQLEHLPMPSLDMFDVATGKYLLGVSPHLLAKTGISNEGLILAEAQREATETSIATSTAQINAFKNFLPTAAPAPVVPAPPGPTIGMTAPAAIAAGSPLTTAEKVAIVGGVMGLAAIVATLAIK